MPAQGLRVSPLSASIARRVVLLPKPPVIRGAYSLERPICVVRLRYPRVPVSDLRASDIAPRARAERRENEFLGVPRCRFRPLHRPVGVSRARLDIRLEQRLYASSLRLEALAPIFGDWIDPIAYGHQELPGPRPRFSERQNTKVVQGLHSLHAVGIAIGHDERLAAGWIDAQAEAYGLVVPPNVTSVPASAVLRGIDRALCQAHRRRSPGDSPPTLRFSSGPRHAAGGLAVVSHH
jgi:hypothetical protein